MMLKLPPTPAALRATSRAAMRGLVPVERSRGEFRDGLPAGDGREREVEVHERHPPYQITVARGGDRKRQCGDGCDFAQQERHGEGDDDTPRRDLAQWVRQADKHEPE